MLWEKETSIVTLGWPKRLGRKDVRVPESLLFAVVCSKPRVPSALCCDGDTASGRGERPWARLAPGLSRRSQEQRWVPAEQGRISSPLKWLISRALSWSLSCGSSFAGRTLFQSCCFPFRHRRSVSCHPAASPDVLHFLPVQ